jgi:transaldolase/glucose-6-phosphate isomerase
LRDGDAEALMLNPIRELERQGQSVWLDYLDAKILAGGELERLIADGLSGLTSNPAIFEKAIGDTADYDERISAAVAKGVRSPIDLYEGLAVQDIQAAADQFRPVFDRFAGRDGFVSLEVSPRLAMDTAGTIDEARRLWRAVDRPNLMVKVPGTAPGVPAVEALIGDGVNVNVTLLFGVEAYLAVAEAHMAGLEALRARGGDISRVHGVASFFVSRIDSQVDRLIDARLDAGAGEQAPQLKALRGQVAIANAKLAYQRYLELVASPRWRSLRESGASPQRLLWASTGVKDPAYPALMYAEALIGSDTVDTMPPRTLAAFKERGRVEPTLASNFEEARAVLSQAQRLGIDLKQITDGLVIDGVRLFAEAFDELLAAVAAKQERVLDTGSKAPRQKDDPHQGAGA